MTPVTSWRDGLLALADGSVFEGEVLGFDLNGSSPPAGPAGGEVVFNTVMTGYQEVLTDPSYAGQTIVFTYPHIGNYGVAPDDDESRRPFCRGLIVRELTARPSNWRAVEPLAGFLSRHGLKAMAGADTRRLTRQIRDAGAIPGVFGPVDGRPGSFDEAALLAAARVEPPTDGRDLVAEVTCSSPYRYGDGRVRSGGLRLRHQAEHPAQPGRGGFRDRRAGEHSGGGGARPPPGRGVPFERAR